MGTGGDALCAEVLEVVLYVLYVLNCSGCMPLSILEAAEDVLEDVL